MNLFSRTKVGVFFIALLFLGWFLYPRELFLGYVLEGQPDLEKSASHYRQYLQKKPFNQFATLRLSRLYERMGVPQQATPLLKSLYEHRRGDWDTAVLYLDHLRQAHEEEELYREEVRLAKDFMAKKKFPKEKIQELLDEAFHYALWKQYVDESYSILFDLMKISKRPQGYFEEIMNLDRGLKKTEDLIVKLKQKIKEEPKRLDLVQDLSEIYLVSGKFSLALQVIEEGLKQHPHEKILIQGRLAVHEKQKNKTAMIQDLGEILANGSLEKEERWIFKAQVASLYFETGDADKAFELYDELLNVFLEQFSHDFEKEKLLVGFYIYEKKDSLPMLLYRHHLDAGGSAIFARDVATLLMQNKREDEAVWWLKEVALKYPQDLDINGLLVTCLVRKKQEEEALKLAQGNSFLTKKVALEMYFMGYSARAKSVFEDLSRIRVKDPDVWFWLGEMEFSEGRKKKGLDDYKKVNALIHDGSRISLKSRGRVRMTPSLEREYSTARQKFSSDLDLQLDWVDLLLQYRRRREASHVLDDLEKKIAPEGGPPAGVSTDMERILFARVRLAFDQKHWREAAGFLEEIKRQRPQLWTVRLDLAHAYQRDGSWKKALLEYEQIHQATGNEWKVEESMREIHAVYDYHLEPRFHMTRLGGGESLEEGGLATRGFLGNDWEFSAAAMTGTYRSPTKNFSGVSIKGNLGVVRHHLQAWTLGLGSGFGFSGQRKTLSPFVALDWHPSDPIFLSMGYEARTLRTDIPQAVSAGVVEDRFKFQNQWTLSDRWTLASHYQLDWARTALGASAIQHTFEPTVTWVLLKKPTLTVGYQWTLVHLDDQGTFLSEVSLVPRINAHYLTLSLSHSLERHLFLEVGGFTGEDFSRHLHLFGGQLFGTHAQFKIFLQSWLDCDIIYNYGRETQSTLSGDFHDVMVSWSGHWL